MATAKPDKLADVLRVAPDIHKRLQELHGLGVLPGSAAATDAARPLGNHVRMEAMTAIGGAIDHLMSWAGLYIRGRISPTFAHMTLMRSTFEGVATARWLVDPTAASEVRVARAIGTSIEDLEERGRIERAAGADPAAHGPDGASAAIRIAEMNATAREAGQAIERRGHTYLVATFGPGEVPYRILCSFAHGGLAVMLAASQRTEEAGDVDPDDLRRIRLGPDPEYTLAVTESAVQYARAAVVEVYAYHGHGRQPTLAGGR